VEDVERLENNIHAGVRILRHYADHYFNEPELDELNRTLLSFAAYNAGPNRINRLRRRAASQGLNPNVWFRNVELVVAKSVGQEPVRYVGNVYKYYVAYKLMAQDAEDLAGKSTDSQGVWR
jgi:membrane-bound lytic murein transglycosylase MltF